MCVFLLNYEALKRMKKIVRLLYPPWTKFRVVYKNHSVCPSVCLFVCPSVCADSCPAHNFFLVWHWLTIFGTWISHHATMCRVHSWSRYELELWPQGQIYRVFDMFSIQPKAFSWFDIGSPYLAHGCITIRQCVAYIHVPDSMLTFDLKVKFIAFHMSSCLTCNIC